SFFQMSPREAAMLDPQQRLLLELSWACLEDGGYAPLSLRGSNTGVFVGVCNYDYRDLLDRQNAPVDGYTSTGSHYACMIANRISYAFNFHGPSVPLDAACASSLFALHSAQEAIHTGQCDLALAGGVNVLCGPTSYASFTQQGMLSPDGRCKTFDAAANGYVRGEGVGVLLLKSLERAVADGDRVYGVILATAVNHGGQARTLTSPNAFAQSQVIQDAHRRAGVLPSTIGYVEAHGTA